MERGSTRRPNLHGPQLFPSADAQHPRRPRNIPLPRHLQRHAPNRVRRVAVRDRSAIQLVRGGDLQGKVEVVDGEGLYDRDVAVPVQDPGDEPLGIGEAEARLDCRERSRLRGWDVGEVEPCVAVGDVEGVGEGVDGLVVGERGGGGDVEDSGGGGR